MILSVLLLWPIAAKAANDVADHLPLGVPPLRTAMTFAVWRDLLPNTDPFLLTGNLSSRQRSAIMTNLPNWIGKPIAGHKMDKFAFHVGAMLTRFPVIAVVPAKNQLLYSEFKEGSHSMPPPFDESMLRKVQALDGNAAQKLARIFDNANQAALRDFISLDEAARFEPALSFGGPASGTPARRSLVVSDMQEGILPPDPRNHSIEWWLRYHYTVSNIRRLAKRFDRIFFLVHTWPDPRDDFEEAVKIVRPLRRVAAERGVVIYKRANDGSPALLPYLDPAEEIFGVGMDSNYCVPQTLWPLMKLGFRVRAIADAIWTAKYDSDPFETHNTALNGLRRGLPVVLTKDIPD